MCAGEVLERLWHGRASVVHIVRGGLFLDGPGRDQQQRLQRVRRRDLLDQRGRERCDCVRPVCAREVLERDWHGLDGRLRSVRGWLFPDGPWRVLHRQLQRVRGGDLLDHGGRDDGVGVRPMRCRAVLDGGRHGLSGRVRSVRDWIVFIRRRHGHR
jgi:hypothetical protein